MFISLHSSTSGIYILPHLSNIFKSSTSTLTSSALIIFDWKCRLSYFPFLSPSSIFSSVLRWYPYLHINTGDRIGPCFRDIPTLFFASFFAVLYAVLFSSLLSLSRVLLASFFVWMLSWTSSFHHHVPFPRVIFPDVFPSNLSPIISQSRVPSLILCCIGLITLLSSLL